MSNNLFKHPVVQHWLYNCWIDSDGVPCQADTPGARFVTSRKVKAGTPGAVKIKAKSAKWYGRVPGSTKAVPLSKNKVAAQQMLAALVRKSELGRAGISDPFEDHRNRPLIEHITDFQSWLSARGNGEKHSRDAASRVRRIIEGCRFHLIGDITLSRVQEFLAGLKNADRVAPALDPSKEQYTKAELAAALRVKPHSITPLISRWKLPATGNGKARRYPQETARFLADRLGHPAGPATINHYVRSVRTFTRWLVKDRRAGDDSLAGLSGVNASSDVRRARRALSPEELGRLLQAALNSSVSFRGLSGRDRYFLYLTACGTGFRASELHTLTRQAFDFQSAPPSATVPAAYTKNGRLAVQPLPTELAELLPAYLADRAQGQLVWPGTWNEDAAQMIQADLEAAGIPYIVEGPDGPLYADFSSLRHSFVSLLDRAGLSLKMAMQLARHSDPKLTMARYGRAALHDLGTAVGSIQSLLSRSEPSEVVRATGTDSTILVCTPVCTEFVQTSDSDCDELRRIGTTGDEGDVKGGIRNPLIVKDFETRCDEMRPDETNAPCRTRTYNPLIKSQLLCQLS